MEDSLLDSTAALSLEISRSLPPPLRRLGDTKLRYRTLKPPKDFRLLVILPGSHSSQIECEMFTASFDERIDFVAISYAWGDPEDTCGIIFNKHEFPITRSLWGALQALRSESESVVVWADAVCINQSDPAERSAQVQKMTQIYSYARSVAIWLGPDRDDSSLGLALIEELTLASDEEQKKIIEDPKRYEAFGALVDVFERDYWSRLWCVQEVWNAREIMVYCGVSRNAWSAFREVQEIFGDKIQLLHKHVYHVSPTLYSWPDALAWRGPKRISSSQHAQYSDLFTALTEHRDKLCSEPRDRVYAVLALLEESERIKFPIDYTISVRRLYTDVVEYLLEKTKRLDVLCAVIPAHDHRSPCQLPSWVPDWAHSPGRNPMSVDFAGFSASGTRDAIATFADQRWKLNVSGIIIDRVVKPAMPMPLNMSRATILATIHQWRLLIQETFGNDEKIQDAFARTICLGRAKDHEPTQWRHMMYDCIYRTTQKEIPGLVLDFPQPNPPVRLEKTLTPRTLCHSYIGPATRGRRLLITKSSMLCLGSWNVRRWDVVCVLLGCSTPVVLRPVKDHYVFVGEAYVDGYMYGKAIEELDNGTRKLQSFELR